MSAERVAVIGSGLGGLAAACTLAARGYAVTVLEKNPWLGGKAAVLERGGYRFDMGPTILTVPSVLKRIFGEAGRKLDDYLDLVPLDPQWRCFFDGGSVLDLYADVKRMQGELQQKAPGEQQSYADFIELSRKLHAISERFFFYRPVGSMWDTFDAGTTLQLSVLKDLMTMRLGQTVAGTVRSMIKDPQVAQMLDHFTQYIGSSPDASPAILCAIAHMQTSEGVWYPRGGTGSIPRALTRLGRELGVEYRTSTPISRIIVENGTATGVETKNGEQLRFAAVVSNADAVRTNRELIGGSVAAKFNRRRGYEPACSGVVFYLGLDKKYDQLLHHSFVFSKDPHEEFDTIYRKGEPAPDPSAYLAAPSVSEPDVAPAGGEALYILVHTPYLRPHHDWKQMLPKYRKVIFDKLARTAGMRDLEKHIVTEDVLTPEDIHNRYGVLNGAIYGIASHGRMNGAFKPSNVSPDVKGLFLAGGAAHPGPGMPMVMMSGWTAADALDRSGIAAREEKVAWPASA